MGLFDGAFEGLGSGIVSGAFSALGGLAQARSQRKAQQREYEHQKEFAQNGIRWRVEDAKAAGIHPLYAIGANTPTYSPQAAVGTDYGLSSAGQNISRAIEAGQTRAERAHAQEVQDAISGAQVGLLQAQTRYYDSQADAIGQRAVDNALDYAHQLASNSEQSVRTQSTQRQPPKPSSNYGVESYNAYAMKRDEYGRPKAITHSQDNHDIHEDIPFVEYLPFGEGLLANVYHKFIRPNKPFLGDDGKWYVFDRSLGVFVEAYGYQRDVYGRPSFRGRIK